MELLKRKNNLIFIAVFLTLMSCQGEESAEDLFDLANNPEAPSELPSDSTNPTPPIEPVETLNANDAKEQLLTVMETKVKQKVLNIDSIISQGVTLHKLIQHLDNDYQWSMPNPKDAFDYVKAGKAVDYFLSEGVAQGNRVIYQVDPRFCSEIVAINNPQPCIDAVEHLRIEQVVVAEFQGRVEIYYEQTLPIIIDYSAAELRFTVNLKDLNLASQLIEPLVNDSNTNGPYGFAELMDGQIQAALEKDAGTKTMLNIDITEDLFVKGHPGKDFDLTVYATGDFMNIEMDSSTQLAVVNLNFAGAEFNYRIFDQKDNVYPLKIVAPKFHGVLAISEAQQAALVAEVDLQTPIEFFINGTLGFEISKIEVAAMALFFQTSTVNIQTNALVTVQANNLNDHGIMGGRGMLQVQMDAGTAIQTGITNGPAQVINGEFRADGSDQLLGSLRATSGDCFGGNPNATNGGLPWALVSCN